MEQAARDIGFHKYSDKTKFDCFKRDGVISTLNDRPLKLVVQFTYLCSNITSTENEVNMHKEKIWIGMEINGGTRVVMVIIVGNGHGDTISNPGRDWLHFT